MFSENPALYFAIVLLVAVLTWFAKAIYQKKNDEPALAELKATFAAHREQQERHRIQMEQHCSSSEKFAEKQTQLLEEMARMLGRIEIHTDITAKGMLQNKRSNGDLAEAIERLAAKIK